MQITDDMVVAALNGHYRSSSGPSYRDGTAEDMGEESMRHMRRALLALFEPYENRDPHNTENRSVVRIGRPEPWRDIDFFVGRDGWWIGSATCDTEEQAAEYERQWVAENKLPEHNRAPHS